jgi:hypothetical protein
MSFAVHANGSDNSVQEDYSYHFDQAMYWFERASEAGEEARICMNKFLEHRQHVLNYAIGSP